jgi:two-component sensor histidine kinase
VTNATERARRGVLDARRGAFGGLRAAARDPSGIAGAPALLEAVRAAAMLGWLSIVAVLVGLAIGLPVDHEEVVLATTLAAAAGHAGLGLLPWARLLPTPRGRLLLNAWSAALIAGVCGLVLTAGGASRLDLLFFLVVPFLAIVHDGRPLVLWLTAATAAYLGATLLTSDPLPRSELVLHLLLLVGSGALGRQLAGAIRRQAEASVEAVRRAELEGAMLAEGHHRVKNSLQVVADLLLLGRPDDAGAGAAFDHAAARIRSIAAVHDVLAERRGGRVPADELLRAVVDAAHPGATTLQADPVALPFSRAQNLGVVVNELVTNAHEHGRGPVAVRLRRDAGATLEVSDAGPGPDDAAWAEPGLGLRLVRQVVEQGLRGTIERGDAGVVRVRFSTDDDAHPGR